MNIPEFSVKNRIFGNMLTVVVIVAGLLASFSMTRELFPLTELDMVTVQTVYRNASPAEVENHITLPIEEEIRSIDGIDEFTSVSTEGMSMIIITLDADIKDKRRVVNEIARKVDRVSGLPAEAEDPEVEEITSRDDVIHVTISGHVEETLLRETAEQLKSRIEAIPGVGFVDKVGWRDPEIWVEVDPNILIQNELPITRVADSVNRQNVNRPGGKMLDGRRDVSLRTVGEVTSLDDIRDVVVRSNADGQQLTIKDIGKVTSTFAEESVLVRANGSSAIILDVKKKRSGDVIDIADEVTRIVTASKHQFEQNGIELGLIDFESYVIKRRLRVLLSNGFLGLLLVLCSLPLVLNVRLAIVTALGIPFSFLFAILVMSYAGITINMITMFGMILVVGMLVDDAIIVSENIYRHMEMGKPRKQAAIDGAYEVMWPVTATVLTTIAAFLPLMFLPGMMGKVLRWVPIIVIITLAASLFEALFILPCHVAEFGKLSRKHKSGPPAANGKGLYGRYKRLLEHILRHRIRFFVIIIACLAASIGIAKTTMRMDLFPADLIEIFSVHVTMPSGTAREYTEQQTAQIEQRILNALGEDEIENLITIIGQIMDSHGANVTRGSRYAMSIVYLTPEKKRDRTAQQIMAHLREVCASVEGVERLQFEMTKPGPPVGKEVDIKIIGKEYEPLNSIAEEIKAHLAEIEGVVDIQDDHEPGKDERRIIVDKKEAARLGVDVDRVARTVYSAFEGMTSTSIRNTEEETKIRVRLMAPYRDQMESLKNLHVANTAGRLIKLERLVEFESDRALATIIHYDGERAVSVTAGVDRRVKGAVMTANKSVWAKFADIPERFPGYRLVKSGEGEETEKTKQDMIQAGIIALLLIYTILVVQFKSFLQPFVVLVAIPFGVIGVILALGIHGKPVSMMAMLGMVGMCGVVVNDAIVLVSFINGLKRSGIPTHDAIIQGAMSRLRPIMLTSFTTVLGMAPVIYGIGGYEPFVAPAAIVLAYGLVFSTFLTLLVVPCAYSIGSDLKAKIASLIRKQEPVS